MSTAGILIIGNEILTGNVQDENTPYLLRELRRQGVDVPRLLEEALAAHPGLSARITAPLGSVAEIADLILATVPED